HDSALTTRCSRLGALELAPAELARTLAPRPGALEVPVDGGELAEALVDARAGELRRLLRGGESLLGGPLIGERALERVLGRVARVDLPARRERRRTLRGEGLRGLEALVLGRGERVLLLLGGAQERGELLLLDERGPGVARPFLLRRV